MNHSSHPDSNLGTEQIVLVGAGVLLALGVIAYVCFGWMNPVTIRGGNNEENLAITRTEAVNMALAAFKQARGLAEAAREWDAKPTNQKHYELLVPFLAFAPTSYGDYMPRGYTINLPTDLHSPPVKVRLLGPERVIYY